MDRLPRHSGSSTRGRTSLTWNSLQFKLDEFQVWLIDQRSAEDKSVVFTIFDGFRIFVDELVAWFAELLFWLTWVGTTVGRDARSSGGSAGVRAAILTLAAFATFALSGLWGESMETLALMLAAVVAVPARRDPARHRRRPLAARRAVRPAPSSTPRRSCPRSRT